MHARKTFCGACCIRFEFARCLISQSPSCKKEHPATEDVRLRNAYLEEMDMRKQLLLSTGILCLMLVPAVSYGQGPGERREEQKQMRPAETGKGAASQERGAERAQERSQDRAQERSQGAEQRAPGASGRDEKGTSSRQTEEKSKAGPSNERPATASDDKRGRGEDSKSSERARDSRHGDTNRDDGRGKSAEQEKSKDGTTSAQKEREGTTTTQKEPSRDQRDGAKNAAEQGRDNRDNRPSTATDTTRTQPSTNAQNAPTGSTSQTQTGQRSNIAVDKQVRISETLQRERLAAPERDLNVSIRVGERIPERVRVHRLPDTIVSIEPEYRDYDYFTTEEEIVIVEPRTHRIVSQIPRDASRLRAAEGTGSTSGTSGYTGTVAAAGGASPCRIMRRDTAGNVTELTPQTVGSTAQQDFISVTVRVPGGATTAPISMGSPDGQIVVYGQGGADCTVTIEPPPAR
jgi:Protein of unknown function (DUF1236)